MRAALHGVSMEEEARRILSQAVNAPEKMSDVSLKYFGTEIEIKEKHSNLHLIMQF